MTVEFKITSCQTFPNVSKRLQTSSPKLPTSTTSPAPTLPIPSPKHNISLNNCDKNHFCPLPTPPPPPINNIANPTQSQQNIFQCSLDPIHDDWAQIVSLLLLCKIFLETAHVGAAFSNPQWCCSSYGQKYCISEEKEKLHWSLLKAAPLTAIWEVRRSSQCWTDFLKELYATGTKNNNTQRIST